MRVWMRAVARVTAGTVAPSAAAAAGGALLALIRRRSEGPAAGQSTPAAPGHARLPARALLDSGSRRRLRGAGRVCGLRLQDRRPLLPASRRASVARRLSPLR